MKYFILLLIIINLKGAYGQGSYHLPPKTFYEKATISSKNFQKKKVLNLSISSDSIKFMWSGIYSSLPLDKINYIRVKEGNKAKNGAIIGGVSMLVLSLSSVLQIQMDPNYELKKNVGGTVTLLTLAGAAIGALIGSAIQQETSYYVHIRKLEFTSQDIRPPLPIIAKKFP